MNVRITFTRFVLITCLFGLIHQSTRADVPHPPFDNKPVVTTTAKLLAQAKTANPDRVAFAEKIGAKIIPTKDGRSFILQWSPAGKKLGDGPVIVTFNGHGSYAYDELFLWQPMAQKYGLSIIAAQWWLGQGEKINDYYQMHEIYPDIETLLRSNSVKPGQVLAHGFSRGAANIYAFAYLDHTKGGHFIGTTLANAGKLEDSFPENRLLLSGGKDALAGTNWILFCGMLEEKSSRSGCTAMTETETWLKSHGARILDFIQDANGGHGGFHRNPDNIERALKFFLKAAGK